MNIFFLHRNPEICASYHCDKHVIKMATEYVQMLSTAIRITAVEENELNGVHYKTTHINNKCNLWVRKSLEHWNWLYDLAFYVGKEYEERYEKIHKSFKRLLELPRPKNIPSLGWVEDPPQQMPEEYRNENCIFAYRTYYNKDKSRFAKWKLGNIPFWYKGEVK